MRSPRAANAAVAIEPLEGRSLFSFAPTALSPGAPVGTAAVVASAPPTFTWSAEAGVSGYQLRVYDATEGTLLNVDVGPTTTSYTVAPGSLQPGGHFVWYVLDLTGKSGVGPASNRLTFSLPTLAPPVALSPGTATGPAAALTTLRPTFTWSAAADVSGYEIHVYNAVERTVFSAAVSATSTTYTVPAGALEPGVRFTWNVRDVIGTTVSGFVSNSLRFSLPALPAPTAVGPGSPGEPLTVVTTLTPTFTWDAVTAITGFSGYQINLFDQTAGTGTTFTASASATSYTPPAGKLAAGHTYVWSLSLRDGSLTAVRPSHPYLHFRINLGAAVVALDATALADANG